MKYRTKIYCALAGTALVSSLSALSMLFFEFRHQLFSQAQTRALTVAATTAALLDAELIKQIQTHADENTPAYAALKQQLKKIGDVNRRPDIFIHYMSIMKPDPASPGQMMEIAGASNDPTEVVHFGDIDVNSLGTLISENLSEYYSPDKFVSDKWGVWISGFAPIYDKNGDYLATVDADISLNRYHQLVLEMAQLFLSGILISFLFAFIGGFLLARRVTLSLRALLLCVREVGHGNLEAQPTLKTRDEFEELANEINTMTRGLKERERLKLNFARYVSQHILEEVLTTESIAKLEGERRKITVLFSDIRQFTQLAEQMAPEKVVSLLNEYFEAMIDVIFQHHGTLDKFLGDGLMVEFGAPLDDAVQEKHAVQAAIGMQTALTKLVEKWKNEGKPSIEIGIGVHTGLAVVGNIGSEKRVEYTAIGDTVNVAARLEQATKLLKKSILISETTYNAVKDEIKATSLGPMILPGREEAITIYSVDPADEPIKNP
jgi:adenylate cyclase